MLCGVAASADGHIWACGHDATILHSADGGHTWTRQFEAPNQEAPLFDLWFTESLRGLAFGAYGLILETSDGGGSWHRRSIGKGDPHLYTLCEGPSGVLYLAGEFGSLFRSIDGGENWLALDTPYEGPWFGVLAPSDGSILVFGLRGTLFRSEDDGVSWRRIATGTKASLFGGLECSDGTVVLVGQAGTILVSSDGGLGFTGIMRPDRRTIAAIVEVAPNHFLLVGEGGIDWIRNPRQIVAEDEVTALPVR
jgi:photosystem II stability/assembly factor-like uncharacterized protein